MQIIQARREERSSSIDCHVSPSTMLTISMAVQLIITLDKGNSQSYMHVHAVHYTHTYLSIASNMLLYHCTDRVMKVGEASLKRG